MFPVRHPDFYRAIPKVELHRHLEGSLRLTTLLEIGRSHGLDVAGTARLRSLVQVGSSEPYTFENFLSKFETLRLFYRSPEVISRVAQEAISDAALDNVRYMELRFTPMALSKAQGFSLAAVMDWVCEGARLAEQATGVKIRLIASVNRHESLEIAEQVVLLAIERQHKGIVGVDLAGNEAHFSGLPFAGLFTDARQSGMHITVHAGEWAGAQNVADAILQLGAERIGHGVRVLEDPYVMGIAREHSTVFEVCITSNYQSGVVQALEEHPLNRMLAAGLKVTLNTDDPCVSQITLGNEYKIACEFLGLSMDALQERILISARAAFLPPDERDALIREIMVQWQTWENGGGTD